MAGSVVVTRRRTTPAMLPTIMSMRPMVCGGRPRGIRRRLTGRAPRALVRVSFGVRRSAAGVRRGRASGSRGSGRRRSGVGDGVGSGVGVGAAVGRGGGFGGRPRLGSRLGRPASASGSASAWALASLSVAPHLSANSTVHIFLSPAPLYAPTPIDVPAPAEDVGSMARRIHEHLVDRGGGLVVGVRVPADILAGQPVAVAVRVELVEDLAVARDRVAEVVALDHVLASPRATEVERRVDLERRQPGSWRGSGWSGRRVASRRPSWRSRQTTRALPTAWPG